MKANSSKMLRYLKVWSNIQKPLDISASTKSLFCWFTVYFYCYLWFHQVCTNKILYLINILKRKKRSHSYYNIFVILAWFQSSSWMLLKSILIPSYSYHRIRTKTFKQKYARKLGCKESLSTRLLKMQNAFCVILRSLHPSSSLRSANFAFFIILMWIYISVRMENIKSP